MILVVCPNLTIDVTIELDELNIGDVQRARRSTRQAGGKGVNVVRALTALGARACVLGFVSGERGQEIKRRLEEENIDAVLIEAPGESRTCTIALEPSGRATVINEPGPSLDDGSALIERFIKDFRLLVREARAVAIAGSLQPGLAPDLYRQIVALSIEAGTFCLVDTSGAALGEALSARPSLAKPNRVEAEALLGRRLASDNDIVRAAENLRDAGAATALVTRGSAGVIVAHAEGVARCRTAHPIDTRWGNPTGAGDALAAGLVVGHVRGFPLEEMIRFGVATSVASLAEGYGRFRAKDVRPEAVVFESLD